MIIGDKELLIVYSKVENAVLDIDSTIAIWVLNVSVASYQASIFKGIWNEQPANIRHETFLILHFVTVLFFTVLVIDKCYCTANRY